MDTQEWLKRCDQSYARGYEDGWHRRKSVDDDSIQKLNRDWQDQLDAVNRENAELRDTLQKRIDAIESATNRASHSVLEGKDTYEGLNPAEAYLEGLCDAFMYARGMS